MLICSPAGTRERKRRKSFDKNFLEDQTPTPSGDVWIAGAKYDPGFDTFFTFDERKRQPTSAEILNHVHAHQHDAQAMSVALPARAVTPTIHDDLKRIDENVELAIWTTHEQKPEDLEQARRSCKILEQRGVRTFTTDFPRIIAQSLLAMNA
jgi:hypothetical protein